MLGKAALSGVASALGIITSALDITSGIIRMLEASRETDDRLKAIQYFRGALDILSGLSVRVAIAAGVIGAEHIAIAAGVSFAIATVASQGLGILERRRRMKLNR